LDENGDLWLIDHGLCFNVVEKLRTVLWDFAGEPMPDEIITALRDFRKQLIPTSQFYKKLGGHLASNELKALAKRADRLISMDHFPFPPNNRRAYPYPPV
jgi:uncharacterized repeat protein (TIGR03843 family)